MSELTYNELSLLLVNEAFKNNLTHITGLSRPDDPGAPVGVGALFATYKKANTLQLSEVLHADAPYPEALIRARQSPYGWQLNSLLQLLSLHPDTPPEPPLQQLDAHNQNRVPSLVVISRPHRTAWPTCKDLTYYGKHLRDNPYLILGMATFVSRAHMAETFAHSFAALRQLGHLALLRPIHDKVIDRLQVLPKHGIADGHTLASIGLQATLLTYNPDTGEILTGIGTLKGLFAAKEH